MDEVLKSVAGGRPCQPTSLDVYQWPEFRSLCGRLGIDLNKTTRSLLILVQGNDPVVVEHRYEADDTSWQTQAPDV